MLKGLGLRVVSGVVLLAATIPVTLPAQSGVPDADWRTYNRTVAGDRFSPLTEITRANVGQLREVCRYALPEVTSLQTGPIVIAGVLYFTTDTISYAIDAANCAEQWKYVRHSATPHPLAVHRGFAYLDGRLFRETFGWKPRRSFHDIFSYYRKSKMAVADEPAAAV